jgi:hypothetical protein
MTLALTCLRGVISATYHCQVSSIHSTYFVFCFVLAIRYIVVIFSKIGQHSI